MESPRTLLQPSAGADATAAAPTRRVVARTPREPPAGAGQLVLGRYRLLGRLGAGGFGVVWRARDELLHREVALKRVPLGPGGDSERAMREALVAARLSHPAIVALYEACSRDGAVYLISELVDGETLGRLMAERALSDERILAVGVALAGALAHAHARGVIHRDIKPQNVLVPRERDGHHAAAKLTDFGGASLAGEDVLTRTGDVLGTLAYMAPEQSEGREVGAEGDLYSLALVLYEALSGSNPVRGPTPAATARRIGRPVQTLAASRPDLSDALTGALDRAIASSPEDRGSVEELRAALQHALAHDLLPARRLPRRARPVPAASLAAVTPPERRARGSPARGLDAAESQSEEWPARVFPPRGWRSRDPEADPEGWPAREPPPGERRSWSARAPAEDWLAYGDGARGQVADQRVPAPGGAAARSTLSRRLWLAGALALSCWQAIAGRPGLALVLLAALVPAVLVGAEDGSSRVPAGRLTCLLAPVLGLAGLAGAYPAIAGQARSAGERALRGALGYWWLTLAAALVGSRLWLALPSGTPPRASWEGSLGLAASHVIAPALTLGVLFGALLWGAGAAVLPWIVRGRGPWLDAAGAGLWALALVLAQPALDRGLLAASSSGQPRGALLAALVGAAVAVAARALRGPAGRECA